MGFTCDVVRCLSAFTPCLEHVRAGGGGSVANALACVYAYVSGIIICLWITSYLYEVTSDTRGYHGDTCGSGDDHVVRLAARIDRT